MTRKFNFTLLAIALGLGTALSACGGSESKKEKAEEMEPVAEADYAKALEGSWVAEMSFQASANGEETTMKGANTWKFSADSTFFDKGVASGKLKIDGDGNFKAEFSLVNKGKWTVDGNMLVKHPDNAEVTMSDRSKVDKMGEEMNGAMETLLTGIRAQLMQPAVYQIESFTKGQFVILDAGGNRTVFNKE